MLHQLDIFGDGARLHHVGMVTGSITDLVGDCDVVEDRTQAVRIAFAEINGVVVELLEPLTKESPVSRQLAAGQKLVHLCFSVANLTDAAQRARAFGFRRITRPVAAPALDGRPILWLLSPHYGLVELVETTDGDR